MSDAKQGKTPPKSKKVGGDGLTKKERRAQKVSAPGSTEAPQQNAVKIVETKPVTESKQPPKTEQKEQMNPEEKTKADLKAERKALFEKERALLGKDKKTQDNQKEKEAGENGPSKAQLRADRRAVQEKQREAKTKPPVEQATPKPAQNVAKPSAAKAAPIAKSPPKKKPPMAKKDASKSRHPHMQMVEHMHYETPVRDVEALKSSIHPAFVELGVRSTYKTVVGANSRSLALLSALKQMVADFSAPPNQEFCRSLDGYLQNSMDYLQTCRPLSASMANTLRYFKLHLTKINTHLTDSEKKTELTEVIETYIVNEIEKAGEAVSLKVHEKISNGDVILTYGCSSLIEKILVDAHTKDKQFSVIVTDSRPFSEGRAMLIRLLAAGISCSFVLINGVSSVMSDVSKILLGSHSLLSNGFVMSRAGAGQIAMIGRDFNKPVLICCETYKFCERVQTDSYVFNEIGDSQQIACSVMQDESNRLTNWKDTDNVVPLDLVYDVALPDVVTAVITELGILPCTSVPVVLRYKLSELSY